MQLRTCIVQRRAEETAVCIQAAVILMSSLQLNQTGHVRAGPGATPVTGIRADIQ